MIIDLSSSTFIGQGESATAEPRTVHAARSMSSTTGLFLAQGTIYYAELRSYIQQAKKRSNHWISNSIGGWNGTKSSHLNLNINAVPFRRILTRFPWIRKEVSVLTWDMHAPLSHLKILELQIYTYTPWLLAINNREVETILCSE